MPRVIGLEGGPCGGKSTAMEYIAVQAAERGVKVECIQEVAGQMLGQLSLRGITYGEIKADADKHYDFQRSLLRSIVEAIEYKRATAAPATLIIADRVDNAAYIAPEMYRAICSDLGFAEPPMYSLVNTVLYFPTLAKHDPARFGQLKAENSARHEANVAEAIAICDANLVTAQTHHDFWLLATENFSRRLTYAGNIALRGFSVQPSGLALG